MAAGASVAVKGVGRSWKENLSVQVSIAIYSHMYGIIYVSNSKNGKTDKKKALYSDYFFQNDSLRRI